MDKRQQLNRAIHRLPRSLARELKYYRMRVERTAVERGAFYVVRKNPDGSLSIEAEDTVDLCLKWIEKYDRPAGRLQ